MLNDFFKVLQLIGGRTWITEVNLQLNKNFTLYIKKTYCVQNKYNENILHLHILNKFLISCGKKTPYMSLNRKKTD